ncbi:glycosyltransferase [Psychroflexus sediminis]|uniref:Glycosyltransferase, GT2 family n=1 Tax=Psychroflexus sediminis TaxID=470826 RepID=A0A1G7UK67_9FLAO|nr:glycosyltransferase [Psychroflexus sediminis]SDG47489.1 Glycosyltransferase, GT2 family [Psychroflexus sediminis]
MEKSDYYIKPDTLVITATLGTRNSLPKTIKSVRENGGNRVHHVLTCPKSKLKALKARYPLLDVVEEPKEKKGIYTALNSVIKKYAKDYKYVTFINDDDYWLSGFKLLFLALDKNQKLDAVYGRTLFVSESNKIIREQASSFRYKAFKALLSKRIVLFTQQATLIKSELFYEIGGFDENYKLIADSKFWAEAIDSGAQFSFIDTLAAAYTLQEGQLSSDKKTQNFEYNKLLKEKMFSKISLPVIVFESIIFRIHNIPVYLKRIFLK